MNNLDNQINKFFSNVQFLSPWLIRFGLGIAFSIHGLSKFPLPPEALIKYFGFSPFLASLVALAELGAGLFFNYWWLFKRSNWKFNNKSKCLNNYYCYDKRFRFSSQRLVHYN